MKLQVDLFTENGKWYASGEVEIPDNMPEWDVNFLKTIVNNQKIVAEGTFQKHIAYIRNKDDNYAHFCNRLWFPTQFMNLKK